MQLDSLDRALLHPLKSFGADFNTFLKSQSFSARSAEIPNKVFSFGKLEWETFFFNSCQSKVQYLFSSGLVWHINLWRCPCISCFSLQRKCILPTSNLCNDAFIFYMNLEKSGWLVFFFSHPKDDPKMRQRTDWSLQMWWVRFSHSFTRQLY